jgi:hypothetical protein
MIFEIFFHLIFFYNENKYLQEKYNIYIYIFDYIHYIIVSRHYSIFLIFQIISVEDSYEGFLILNKKNNSFNQNKKGGINKDFLFD